MSGPQCSSNPPTLNPCSGGGHVEKLGGLDSYVTGSPDSKLAIVLIIEVFGYEAPILRKLADKVAAAGYFGVVPDFLHGDPFLYNNACRPLPIWLKDHEPDKGFEEAKPVIEALKSKGISAIGAAGFCWGAKVVVELSKFDFIQATILLHPSFVSLDDIKDCMPEIVVFGKGMSGPQCCSNPPTLNPSSGAGHVKKLGGLDSYVTGSPDSKLAIVLISDVFGYEAPILRKLADKVAAAGYFVVVPDFLHGDPFLYNNAYRPLPIWLKDHEPDKGFEEAKLVIEALKSKGISAIGAAGFCWGAKVVVELSKFDFFQATILLHPSFVSLDDIKGVRVPIAILGAEIDNYSPPQLLQQFQQILATKSEIDSYVKVFPKVGHGWTVRYDVEDEICVKAAEEAHQILLQWFSKYVNS